MTGAISQDWESCQFPFVLDEKSTVVPVGGPESSREAIERVLMETLGRTQSERRRWLALASWFSGLVFGSSDRLE